MQHPNAVLTPRARRRLVALVEEQGFTFRAAAAALGVSVSTAHTWVVRWRAADPATRVGLACLADRSSRPHRQRRLMAPLEQARIILARQLRAAAHRLGPAPDRG